MCVYCMCGDWTFRHYPPWSPYDPFVPWPPTVPAPLPNTPVVPWSLEQLREFQDLLRRVKELEDKLGCPCEPNKADYLDLMRRRIEDLEKRAGPGGQ